MSVTLSESTNGFGHNSGEIRLSVEVRMFNRIFRLFADGQVKRTVEVAAGTSVADLLQRFGIPESEVFIAFINGRDITDSPGRVDKAYQLDDGDVLALSGPVPYSWGYGAPVV
jgi:sulfur carrier protein ThiS